MSQCKALYPGVGQCYRYAGHPGPHALPGPLPGTEVDAIAFGDQIYYRRNDATKLWKALHTRAVLPDEIDEDPPGGT